MSSSGHGMRVYINVVVASNEHEGSRKLRPAQDWYSYKVRSGLVR